MIDFICLHKEAIYPTRGSRFSVGYDLYCPSNIVLNAKTTTKIPLGISLSLDDFSLWAQIVDRSSMGKNGMHVFGGVIDPDYTGEICVLLYNTNDFNIQVNPGDRIAQLVFHTAITDKASDPQYVRGDGGFGSTGK